MNIFTNNLCNNLVIVILLLSPITCGGYYYDDCFKEIQDFDANCTCEPNVLECSIGRVDFDSALWTKFSRPGRIHNSTNNYSYSSVHLNVHKFDGVNVSYFPSVLFNNLAPSVKEITLTNWKFTSISSVKNPLKSSLKSLTIKNNYSLTKIINHRALANLAPYLERLDLSSNALIDIHKTAFRGLKYLLEVRLEDNNISFLPDFVFRESTKLANISLSSNSISILTKNTFAGLLSVEHLEIDSNKLFTIKNDTFRDMAKLRELDLSLNQINSLEPLAFRGLIAVETIDLSNNHLRFLPPEILSYCHALRQLTYHTIFCPIWMILS
ncbi:insulin-like growth factor-binding protein complex acid labile subunit [Panonychus citri]|uniref:insulin-like growth factor-binding protein complex acid labile subunit n=1 Tax=Panonychus citri TaxID=50023 RepID=UPI002307407D|nr:insulin-like growth factor-binding protein complex acid labile subunit [Panonychus citri]XP_053204946.1 insulin-like growth factor-binding protein complex acid labile subunit [Panonychus citri]